MRILITGINGFVGSHLSDFIINNFPDSEIHGTVRTNSNLDNIKKLINHICLHELQLHDPYSIKSILDHVKPNKIFHLAGQSNVMNSFTNPIETFQTNVLGTINLFESIRKSETDPIILFSSSSEVYGKVFSNEIPIKETNPLRPISPYGVSKLAADRLAFQYFSSYGLKTIIARTFSHTGPRRPKIFAESNFAKQIVDIERGYSKPVVKVGNLESTRTFTDVREIAQAYWLASEKCEYGEAYNIGSTDELTIGDILTLLIKLSQKKIDIIKDNSRIRPSDISHHVPDISKFIEKTKWTIQTPIQKTLEDLLDYWRNKNDL